jgi:hypothetical protein
MICRFLNASTADGYNPYRVTREGFDWEVPEPDNPWAYIGYWGDHQIIYLLKFLEQHEKFFPGQLLETFKEPTFVYANVPYRVKNYDDILKNPQDTIDFDRPLHEKIMQRSIEIGADGKLVNLQNGKIARVSFTEKILVNLLTKLSNFVPDAGIWLNTQRPEWNDANNALVGNGASLVTLYHLRRYINFFVKVLSANPNKDFMISKEVLSFFQTIAAVFNEHTVNLQKGFSDTTRKAIVDKLGNAGSDYRSDVYKGFAGKTENLHGEILLEFFILALAYINQSIATNKRDDGLYHSYNLLEFKGESIKVQHLQLMLEGQAAIISSGYLSAKETTGLMNALFLSDLWRNDQQSFMLYPFKVLPSFLEKNVIPADLVEKSNLLKKLLTISNTQIIKKDENGNYHFNSSLRNVQVLKEELMKLPLEVDKSLVNSETESLCDIYETVFQHRYFTGRSGSFYKYEGLGSIYWHLVSKLLQTLGENIMQFSTSGSSAGELKELIYYYHKVKEGIGVHKNPKNYGAFPTDPYSHTPSMMGAQQPGMTGQVKEDILSRFNELGLLVKDGEIKILPILLNEDEFILNGTPELKFTFCNTPFTYKRSKDKSIEVYWKSDQKPEVFNGDLIPEKVLENIYKRKGTIDKIIVFC